MTVRNQPSKDGLGVQSVEVHDTLILRQHDITNLLVADMVTEGIDVFRSVIGVVSQEL